LLRLLVKESLYLWGLILRQGIHPTLQGPSKVQKCNKERNAKDGGKFKLPNSFGSTKGLLQVYFRVSLGIP
jgi:hypothetical protein